MQNIKTPKNDSYHRNAAPLIDKKLQYVYHYRSSVTERKMVNLPSFPDRTSRKLEEIHAELAQILARYRRIVPNGGHVCQIGDVLRMHAYVWDAVALLRLSLPHPESQATLLAHFYQSRRDPHSGAVTFAGLAEMIEVLKRLLERRTMD